MLQSLSIRDIVLIDRLDLPFEAGLSVLTGETGAGKSILLDSLGLALGARADARLVRQGAAAGMVTAAFAPPAGHPALALAADQGLTAEDGVLLLRRQITPDGRSRAFVNDQPVSVALLAELGALLVELHGQNDDRGLLNAAGHRMLLDAFGGLGAQAAGVAEAWRGWQATRAALAEAEEKLAAARREEEYLRHVAAELRELAPETGEEDRLAGERAGMMNHEKMAGELGALSDELGADGGVEAQLRGALRRLERLASKQDGALDGLLAAMERAATETSEAVALLDDTLRALDFDEIRLGRVEERLFALRAAARKHHCQADDLAALAENFAAQIAALDNQGAELGRLAAAEHDAAKGYRHKAQALSEARIAAAAKLDKLVARELPPLKLDKAKFASRIDALPPDQWSANGGDRVEFQISTNPGAPMGPLTQIASGGEMARFVLALKVVLATKKLGGAGAAPTMVFDEVDRGIGGAVADAVGERLARLAADAQVLVVTHSPQVAARGHHHWRIAKDVKAKATTTRVEALTPEGRREEIARMLSGAVITAEARAAADRLLGVGA